MDQQQHTTSGCLWKKCWLNRKISVVAQDYLRAGKQRRLREYSGKVWLHAYPVLILLPGELLLVTLGDQARWVFRHSYVRTLQQGNHHSNAYRVYLNYRAQWHPTFLYSCKLKKCDVVLQVGNWGTEQFCEFSKTPQQFWGNLLNHSSEIRAWSKFF